MREISYVVLAFLCVCLLGYGGWHLKRWFNYEFEYKDKVEETIREMVKEECLKVNDE
jgi:hypothetical protein